MSWNSASRWSARQLSPITDMFLCWDTCLTQRRYHSAIRGPTNILHQSDHKGLSWAFHNFLKWNRFSPDIMGVKALLTSQWLPTLATWLQETLKKLAKRFWGERIQEEVQITPLTYVIKEKTITFLTTNAKGKKQTNKLKSWWTRFDKNATRYIYLKRPQIGMVRNLLNAVSTRFEML